MNIQEFAALKQGDAIENSMLNPPSVGRVTELKKDGVMLAWGGNGVVTFFYSVNSTAWFYWSKIDETAS